METLFTNDIATGFPFASGEDDDYLLNFSLEGDEIEDGTKNYNISKGPSSVCSSHGSGIAGGVFSLPADEEEELEWISNKDAFPAIEFGILDEKPDIGLLGQHSPVSVLDSVIVSGNGGVRTATTTTTTDNRTGSGTLRVPTGFPNDTRKKRIGRKRRISFDQYKHLFLNLVDMRRNYKQETRVKVSRNKGSAVGRRCSHCHSDKTPQWRTGPMGDKTLCNACGVRYKSGRLVPEYRPANSPTFSTVLHSNSHRKIMEMRKVKEDGTEQQMGMVKKTF